MAIAYKEEPLPEVETYNFDINQWGGLNRIDAAQQDYEMADCKNMSSDNYPYASPRSKRMLITAETDIKRIFYSLHQRIIWFIDKDDYLCSIWKGDDYKNYVSHNGEPVQLSQSECKCTNVYDYNCVFYPEMCYVDTENDNELVRVSKNITFTMGPQDIQHPVFAFSDKVYIENLSIRKMSFKVVLPTSNNGYGYGTYKMPKLRIFAYDANGKSKISGITDRWAADAYISGEDDCGQVDAVINGQENEYTISVSSSVKWEAGDYIRIVLWNDDYVGDYNNAGNAASGILYLIQYTAAYNTYSVNWKLYNGFYPELDYGVVYNNRIVGVKGSDIRASALGDFTNFWEYADEAGNPSATGAYATDVGSSGSFMGIRQYNNVLLLFKKDIVYEMYGSMPYTITELCSTGCISNDSIAEIDGVLYWASPKGIVKYSGGVPTVISHKIDVDTSGKCVAGTDGRRYYVNDGKTTYVYDTVYNMWHKEENEKVNMFYNSGTQLYMLRDDGIYQVRGHNEEAYPDFMEKDVEWEFETKDFSYSSEFRKNLSKLWIRAKMDNRSRLEIYVRQNGGEWTRCAVKTAEKDEMFDFKLRIKKCDSFAIKFKGAGNVKILDIHGKVTVGTSKHRSGQSLNVYRR